MLIAEGHLAIIIEPLKGSSNCNSGLERERSVVSSRGPGKCPQAFLADSMAKDRLRPAQSTN